MSRKHFKLKMKNVIITCLVGIGVLCLIYFLFINVNRAIALKNLTISLKSTSLNLYEEDVGQLDIELSDKQFIDDLKYDVDHTEIIQIDHNGNYKALKTGTAHISIGVQGSNQKVDCLVHVSPLIKIQDLQISHVPKYDLYPGMTFAFQIDFLPKTTTQRNLHIRSTNPQVFMVDDQGNVEVKGIGEASIQFSVDHTSLSKEIKLKSIQKPDINQTAYFRHNGQIIVENDNGYQLSLRRIEKKQNVIYRSQNNQIASVTPDGILYAKRPGHTVIECQEGQMTYKCSLIVKCDNGLIQTAQLSNSGIDQCSKLMIVAHPDDETLWGGGHLLDGGWFVVVLTNGYNQQRVTELTNALSVSQTHFIILDYPDLKKKKVKDDWTYVQKGINKDVQTLLTYKKWNQIVTHNALGEYGHIHHKMTHQIVKKNAVNLKLDDQLYYFGKFYSQDGKFYGKPKLPQELKPTYEGEKLTMKKKMIDQFTSQRKAIEKYWEQMIPFEEWTKASR